jgi:LPPG:FO 2-phospho-L-lactate transferase
MKVVALSGGVGGARFLRGLARAVAPEDLTAVVNTGDDFEHWGLFISPDVDTVVYTLAGLSNEERGWGLADESFRALELMRSYGEDDWFALGDRDIAMHLARTRAWRSGERLTTITGRLARALGVRPTVLPMSDEPCRTIVETREHGALPFQTWFVRHRAEPAALGVRFEGGARATREVLDAIRAARLVLIGPSNPYVSIDPILSLPEVRDAVFARPVIAVSPIVGGRAIKGPLASMIPGLAREPASAAAVARHYERASGGRRGLAGIVVQHGDAVEHVATFATEIVMMSVDDSVRLARETLAFAESLS